MHSRCEKCEKRKTKYDPRSFRKPCDVKFGECNYSIQYPVTQYHTRGADK